MIRFEFFTVRNRINEVSKHSNEFSIYVFCHKSTRHDRETTTSGAAECDTIRRPSGGWKLHHPLASALVLAPLACEGEQQYVLILIRNKGQYQLDKGNMR